MAPCHHWSPTNERYQTDWHRLTQVSLNLLSTRPMSQCDRCSGTVVLKPGYPALHACLLSRRQSASPGVSVTSPRRLSGNWELGVSQAFPLPLRRLPGVSRHLTRIFRRLRHSDSALTGDPSSADQAPGLARRTFRSHCGPGVGQGGSDYPP